MIKAQSIADVLGISVGHFTDLQRITGCSVVLCGDGAEAAVDVRGGAPGTRETDLLGSGKLVHEVHAILLTGGSAFGLAAADGVMRFLAERGIGFKTEGPRIPIVPAAVLFDLGIGSSDAYPDGAAGYAACQAARPGECEEGCVGAGTGATVGKSLGLKQAVKSGIGSAALRLGDGTTVGALVALNALGDIVLPTTGRVLAAGRDPVSFKYTSAVDRIIHSPNIGSVPVGNTTIGVIATDAKLSRDDLVRVASLAHDGLARTVRPSHTLYDGDTFFAIATGRATAAANPTAVAVAAGEVVATAIIRAILAARPLGGLPSANAR